MAKRNRNRNAAPVATSPALEQAVTARSAAIQTANDPDATDAALVAAAATLAETATLPEPEPVAKYSPCECGCGLPARRRFVVGHDARKHAADALAARARRSGSTIEEQIARDIEHRKATTKAKAAAKRAADKAEYAAAMAAALAVKAETSEQTAEALAADAEPEAEQIAVAV